MLIFLALSLTLSTFVSAETGNFSATQSRHVTLYDHDNYGGSSVTVPIPTKAGDCTNVLEFNDRTSSVLLDEGCVRLWQNIDCKGGTMDILAPGEADLITKDFNDNVTSISNCEDPCPNFKKSVEIVMHLNGANDLASHAASVRRVLQEWFPSIQAMLFTQAYQPIHKIDVYYDERDGEIHSFDREIHFPQKWIRDKPQDRGMFIHELTHIIQQSKGDCPKWVYEGTAELMRRFYYEPKTRTTKPSSDRFTNAWLGSWLLDYLNTYLQRPLFHMITQACRDGTWRESWLKDVTGKDENQWWRQMVRDNEYPWKRVK